MKKNDKGFTLVELLAVIVIMGILMMVAIPSISRVIENSRKDSFVGIAKSYGNAARTLWTSDNLTCNGVSSSAVDDGDYYILINSKAGARETLPVLVDQGGKSSWGNRDVNGYIRVNISTVPGRDTNRDGVYDIEPKRVTKFYVALSDGIHGLIDDNTLMMDELKRGNIVMSLSGSDKKKIELTVDDGRLDCGKDLNNEYVCTEVTPVTRISGLCVDDQNNAGFTGNYQYKYYGSLNDALNGSAETNAGSAAVGSYEVNGKKHIVLLKENVVNSTINPAFDFDLSLGGHKLTVTDTIGMIINGKNITIDGRASGSEFVANNGSGTSLETIQINSGSLKLNGGNYKLNTASVDQSSVIRVKGGTFEAVNANIDSTRTNLGKGHGVFSDESTTVTLTNTSVAIYGNYTVNAAGNAYESWGYGVMAYGDLYLNNSYVYGTHCGVQPRGTTYVNGGTYEGHGHGGFYFAGEGMRAYVKDAAIRYCEMKGGFYSNDTVNYAGFYAGGSNNQIIKFDNCDIYGPQWPFVLRGSSAEQFNTIYISNSRINLDYRLLASHPAAGVRVDNNSHKLYIGAGCNFTRMNTTTIGRPPVQAPAGVTETTDTYRW